MSEFLTSTQATHWLLSPAKISARRSAAHNSALSHRTNLSPQKCLTLEEEWRLRRFHERRIVHFMERIKFPPKVAATSISYFKRFFVDHSVMDFDPAAIACVAMYVAGKVEEVVITADYLIERMDELMNGGQDGELWKVGVGTVLGVELEFLQSLSFYLICFHPFRCVGMLAELLKDKHGLDVESIGMLMHKAEYITKRRVMLSDLCLTKTPGVLAIATVVVAAESIGIGEITVEGVLETVKNRGIDVGSSGPGVVKETVEELRKLKDRAGEDEMEAVVMLERKRRECGEVDNFLTRRLREEAEDADLERVDAEEGKRSRQTTRKYDEMLGLGPRAVDAESDVKRLKMD
eukprot:GFKZ01013115.1.p1 GENE.GFKZ01013115.1~~GFKZ01013115.1.p1  ORF type:complete len:349 (+),score=61.88 GFKZ01013115.1:243-1289(+)